MFPGPYRIENYRCEVRCLLSNKTPTGTYRAPGRFEAHAARERQAGRRVARQVVCLALLHELYAVLCTPQPQVGIS